MTNGLALAAIEQWLKAFGVTFERHNQLAVGHPRDSDASRATQVQELPFTPTEGSL